MMRTLSKLIFLFAIVGMRVAIAGEVSLHEAMLPMTAQTIALETEAQTSPNLSVLNPVVKSALELARDTSLALSGLKVLESHAAHSIEDYRRAVMTAFLSSSDSDEHFSARVAKSLVWVKDAISKIESSQVRVDSMLEQTRLFRSDLESLLVKRPPQRSRQPTYPEWDMFKTSNLKNAFVVGLLLSSQAIALSPTYKPATSDNAIMLWQEPTLPFTPSSLLLPCLANTAYITEVSKKTYEKSSQNFIPPFLSVLAGKATELWLAEHCDKASAKALGKIAKGIQAGKTPLEILSASVAAYTAKTFADATVDNTAKQIAGTAFEKISPWPILPLAAGAFVALTTVERYSHPKTVSALIGAPAPEAYQGLDFWFMRPFLIKPLTTCARYCFEKIIQQRTAQSVVPRLGAYALSLRMLPVSADSAKHLSEGANIGVSKLVSGMIATVLISTSEVIVDARSQDPEYADFFSRGQKVMVDLAAGTVSSVLLGIALPVTLVAFKPRNLAALFLIYFHCYYGLMLL